MEGESVNRPWKATNKHLRRGLFFRCIHCDNEKLERIHPKDAPGGVGLWCGECEAATEHRATSL